MRTSELAGILASTYKSLQQWGKEHKETKLKITSKKNTNIALRRSVADKGRAGGNLLI